MLYKWTRPVFLNFTAALEAGRLPQAVIIAGDEAAGSAELALECARYFLCDHPASQEPCGQCPGCRAFAADCQPDLLLLLGCTASEAEKDYDLSHNPSDLSLEQSRGNSYPVRIDSVRKMAHWVAEAPQVGARKAVIINHANLLQEGAANALLKTFEEPPAYALIILVTRSLEALLPTLLSRAFKLQIPRCTLKEAWDYLKLEGQDPEAQREAGIALTLAGGAPLLAAEYLKSGLGERVSTFTGALCEACDGGSLSALRHTLGSLPEEELLLILRELVLEVLKYKAGVPREELPLLSDPRTGKLGLLKAEALFEVADLIHEAQQSRALTQRAPTATLYTLLEKLFRGYPVGTR